ncbi:MAG: RdgB/HAM1 family non-canonical purine NTP pyrophosphatase [Gammaproteobacteria bacterium]
MKLVLASSNPGKLREIDKILKPYGLEVVPQSDFDVPDIEETGLTFVENALLKARNAAAKSGLPAISDDSGLEVDALKGKPGICSARYSGADVTDEANVQHLLANIESVPAERRTARFRCVAVLMQDERDPSPLICEGVWEGTIAGAPRGENGFGYDPVFLISGSDKTSAQLEPVEKDRLSHRGKAFRALAEAIAAQLRSEK